MSLDYRWEWLASIPNTTLFEWKAYNPKLTKLFNDSIIKKLSKVRRLTIFIYYRSFHLEFRI